jgi:hypothetical protein
MCAIRADAHLEFNLNIRVGGCALPGRAVMDLPPEGNAEVWHVDYGNPVRQKVYIKTPL